MSRHRCRRTWRRRRSHRAAVARHADSPSRAAVGTRSPVGTRSSRVSDVLSSSTEHNVRALAGHEGSDPSSQSARDVAALLRWVGALHGDHDDASQFCILATRRRRVDRIVMNVVIGTTLTYTVLMPRNVITSYVYRWLHYVSLSLLFFRTTVFFAACTEILINDHSMWFLLAP